MSNTTPTPRPQTDIVLAMLRKKSPVTKLTALAYGIGNLGDVIMRLRRRGHAIDTVIRKDEMGRKYTRYAMAPAVYRF